MNPGRLWPSDIPSRPGEDCTVKPSRLALSGLGSRGSQTQFVLAGAALATSWSLPRPRVGRHGCLLLPKGEAASVHTRLLGIGLVYLVLFDI